MNHYRPKHLVSIEITQQQNRKRHISNTITTDRGKQYRSQHITPTSNQKSYVEIPAFSHEKLSFASAKEWKVGCPLNFDALDSRETLTNLVGYVTLSYSCLWTVSYRRKPQYCFEMGAQSIYVVKDISFRIRQNLQHKMVLNFVLNCNIIFIMCRYTSYSWPFTAGLHQQQYQYAILVHLMHILSFSLSQWFKRNQTRSPQVWSCV